MINATASACPGKCFSGTRRRLQKSSNSFSRNITAVVKLLITMQERSIFGCAKNRSGAALQPPQALFGKVNNFCFPKELLDQAIKRSQLGIFS